MDYLVIIINKLGDFCTYMHYCKSLKFEDRPNYDYLNALFFGTLNDYHLEYDNMFDWSLTEPSKKNPTHRNDKPKTSLITFFFLRNYA